MLLPRAHFYLYKENRYDLWLQRKNLVKRRQKTSVKERFLLEKDVKTFRSSLHKKVVKIKGKTSSEFVKTGIEGFDRLLEEGIPRNSSLLVAGGAGTGKTNLCLPV